MLTETSCSMYVECHPFRTAQADRQDAGGLWCAHTHNVDFLKNAF